MSDTSLPRCSVVIRCCNEEHHIGRLLSGITQQTIRDAEIIVVDSGSTDATLSIASRYPVKIRHIHPDGSDAGELGEPVEILGPPDGGVDDAPSLDKAADDGVADSGAGSGDEDGPGHVHGIS